MFIHKLRVVGFSRTNRHFFCNISLWDGCFINLNKGGAMKSIPLIVMILWFGLRAAQWEMTDFPADRMVNCFAAMGSHLYAGTSAGVYGVGEGGSGWTDQNQGLTDREINALSTFKGSLYAGTNNGGVFMSADSSNHWSPSGAGLPGLPVASVAVCNPFVVVIAGAEVYRSRDNGMNWARTNPGLSESMPSRLFSNRLLDVFAITRSGVLRTGDYGVSWESYSGVLGAIGAVTEPDPHMYAADKDRLYRSIDGGVTWKVVRTALEGTEIKDLVLNNSLLFACTAAKGVFRLADGDSIWVPVNQGLPDLNIVKIAVCGKSLFAASSQGGVWKRPLEEITVVEAPSPASDTGAGIVQNNPNPFNPSTVIAYSMPGGKEGFVKIYSGDGSLVLSRKVRGSGSLNWNAGNRASGVYLCQLSLGHSVFTRKMMLIR
jgi:hypothetical protein